MAHEPAVTPGDGHQLQPYRWWQMFSRSLFHLHLLGPDGGPEIWSVDVRPGGDDDGVARATFYRNGIHHGGSELPARFVVSGGTIEVAVSGFGLRRCHYVMDDGSERQLTPDPRSAEGRRARLDRHHPGISRAVGAGSVIVLIIAVVLGIPQIIEQIAQVPLVAETMGTFVSPVRLSTGANIALVVATVAASTERALRLRYNRILDGGLFDGGGDD